MNFLLINKSPRWASLCESPLQKHFSHQSFFEIGKTSVFNIVKRIFDAVFTCVEVEDIKSRARRLLSQATLSTRRCEQRLLLNDLELDFDANKTTKSKRTKKQANYKHFHFPVTRQQLLLTLGCTPRVNLTLLITFLKIFFHMNKFTALGSLTSSINSFHTYSKCACSMIVLEI